MFLRSKGVFSRFYYKSKRQVFTVLSCLGSETVQALLDSLRHQRSGSEVFINEWMKSRLSCLDRHGSQQVLLTGVIVVVVASKSCRIWRVPDYKGTLRLFPFSAFSGYVWGRDVIYLVKHPCRGRLKTAYSDAEDLVECKVYFLRMNHNYTRQVYTLVD